VTEVTPQEYRVLQFCEKEVVTMKEILAKATIIDVRTPNEYLQGHFPGALNIPLHELTARLTEIKEMKQPIVMYCLSGGRSGVAVSLLKQTGVAEVYNAGGIQDILQYKQ
jgi:phage shock protein E